LALQRTYEMVKQMLAGRPDVLAELGGFGMYLIAQEMVKDDLLSKQEMVADD
jgi:hypothetical protein